ncbi:copper-resistance protein, CopA family [Sphingomonas laterariae]|uniref:Copper-resistance protein, CopA family n=1 Tax=Edaphosphingomonas laterariae TaxID=861865 RepID=A0A239EE73_9SPHN|nr:copper resistance system multicopper oxidase [Sphingomonas laterariae]SNS42946.1 copper-resistance protein, CopA family [Sphingomonas laterariae]
MNDLIDRRGLLRGASLLSGGLMLNAALPAWAQSGTGGLKPDMPTLSGEDIALKIGHSAFTVGGRTGHAITVNGTLPAPLIRLREGQNVRLAVTNTLDEDTSIHWHGLILPFQMDGVPGVSFPGIRPRETFTYEFPIKQSGTYWYHSHSGLQEQMGHYGPIIIDPAGADPVAYDREHVIVLSDWSFLHPHEIFRKLKAQGGYFNRQQQTLIDNAPMSAADRATWGRMRMDPTDISDVTGTTYTYLINGHGPGENWTGLFRPGERVRLRFINASAMTIFNVRIPGLPMTVVGSDGQYVRPVTVDEFQITVAETFDVIVAPTEDRAFTLVAESVDRSGMARGTLAPRAGMSAEVPPLRPRPTLTMKDMGMGGMDHSGMDHGDGAAMDHGSMKMRDKSKAPPGMTVGVGVESIASMPVDRTGDPGLGLEDVGHKVLTYRDLISLTPNPDTRAPTRTVELHLTGTMERFMWSFDGEKYSEGTEPIRFERNERVRVRLVNDSMMAHPIHLHGHFFEVVNGHTGNHPVKHTVNVLPGGIVDFDLTADAPGDWAFHCHLLLHMHAGMFRVVSVRPLEGEAA